MSVREERFGADFKYKKQFVMKKGDIVLSRIDCSHGAIGVVPEELDSAVCSGEFYVLIPKRMNSLILWYLLRNKPVSEQMIGLSSGMTGRHRISREQLLKIKVPKINESLIKKFVKKMEEYVKLLKESNKLKQEALAILGKELG